MAESWQESTAENTEEKEKATAKIIGNSFLVKVESKENELIPSCLKQYKRGGYITLTSQEDARKEIENLR